MKWLLGPWQEMDCDYTAPQPGRNQTVGQSRHDYPKLPIGPMTPPPPRCWLRSLSPAMNLANPTFRLTLRLEPISPLPSRCARRDSAASLRGEGQGEGRGHGPI